MTKVPSDHEFFFAVGSPSTVMSSVWRIWTWPGKSDIYVSEKGSVGSFKVSLHQDGNYRIAFADQFVREQRAKENWSLPDRATDTWVAPEISPGIQMPFSVLIPGSELRAPSPGWVTQKPIAWLTQPPPNFAYEIRLYLGNTRVRKLIAVKSPDGPLAELWNRALPDGWVLVVLAKCGPFSVEGQRVIEATRQRVLAATTTLNPALLAGGRLRTIARAVTEEGYRQFIDMALDVTPATTG